MMIGVILVLLLVRLAVGEDATHSDLEARLVTLEEQAEFQSCLLQLPAEDRTPAVVAECATQPPS